MGLGIVGTTFSSDIELGTPYHRKQCDEPRLSPRCREPRLVLCLAVTVKIRTVVVCRCVPVSTKRTRAWTMALPGSIEEECGFPTAIHTGILFPTNDFGALFSFVNTELKDLHCNKSPENLWSIIRPLFTLASQAPRFDEIRTTTLAPPRR
jgi:hypothetical protein